MAGRLRWELHGEGGLVKSADGDSLSMRCCGYGLVASAWRSLRSSGPRVQDTLTEEKILRRVVERSRSRIGR